MPVIDYINPFLVGRPAQVLERYVRDLGFRGLKLHPAFDLYYPNDSLVYPLYAKAEELGVPVIVHTGASSLAGSRLKYGDPICLDDVAADFPGLKIVQAHGGRGFWHDRALFLTRLHQNLYLDISGLPARRLLAYFPRPGAERPQGPLWLRLARRTPGGCHPGHTGLAFQPGGQGEDPGRERRPHPGT